MADEWSTHLFFLPESSLHMYLFTKKEYISVQLTDTIGYKNCKTHHQIATFRQCSHTQYV